MAYVQLRYLRDASKISAAEPPEEAVSQMGASLTPFRPTVTNPWDRTKAAHLLNRATFAARPEDVERAVRQGLNATVDELLSAAQAAEDFPPPDFTTLRSLWENVYGLARMRAPEAQRAEARRIAFRADVEKFEEVRRWWVRRMIVSPQPLREKMVLFWHGLLVSGRPEVEHAENLYRQNELFRRMALGNFQELILATCKDPAMLEYLDNRSNRKGRPNENFARELLELFTLGIGNYTEQDIKEAARAFTGWTLQGFEFTFNPAWHDGGPKTFLGRTGHWDGTDIVRIIFEQPAASRYLPRRLFAFFAYPDPEDSLVEEMAAVFRRNNFEVAPLLRAILTSEAFYSPRAIRTQVKSPAQLVVGTARLLELPVEMVPSLVRAMDLMGQALMAPPNVGGWPSGERWITTSTLLVRYNFSALVLTGGMPGVAARPQVPPPLPPGLARAVDGARTASEAVARVAQLLGVPLDPLRQKVLLAALGVSDPQAPFNPSSADGVRAVAHLLMSSPDYQLC
ncbi:MAG: DUF1800 family protein [bacterium]